MGSRLRASSGAEMTLSTTPSSTGIWHRSNVISGGFASEPAAFGARKTPRPRQPSDRVGGLSAGAHGASNAQHDAQCHFLGPGRLSRLTGIAGSAGFTSEPAGAR